MLVKGSRFMRMERGRVRRANDAEKTTTMLLELAQWLAQDIRAFNVFNYITLRAVLATMTALTISFVLGPAVIRWLAAKKIGQSVRDDGPQTHLVKAGTPTMGGALILISLGISTLLWADLSNRFVWIVLIVTLGFGAVGWVDDWRKVVYRNPDGLSARGQVLLAVGDRPRRRGLHRLLDLGAEQREGDAAVLQWVGSGFTLELPAQGQPDRALLQGGVLSAGHVRLHRADLSRHRRHQQRGEPDRRPRRPGHHADGDGRRARSASSPTSPAMPCSRSICCVPYIPGAGELTVFCGALAGAGLGFLWFNAYPAEVFMGDVGALALGAALGTVAVIVRQEIVLFIMGGVFVAETLSVMLQVGCFKYTKMRTARAGASSCMAPLHHHFEQSGWKETQVVVRFWIITILLVLFGLSTLKIR